MSAPAPPLSPEDQKRAHFIRWLIAHDRLTDEPMTLVWPPTSPDEFALPPVKAVYKWPDDDTHDP